MKKNSIKTIIFDLGVVLLDIDVDSTLNQFKKIGADLTNPDLDITNRNSLFQKIERGELSEQEIIDRINKHLPVPVENKVIRDIWNATIVSFPKEKIAVLHKLKDFYKVYLLSNTNQIHYEKFNDIIINEYNRPFNSYFDKAFYSHELKMSKPDPKIYETVINEIGDKPESCLFLDDKIENLEVPAKMGVQTQHVSPNFDFVAYFKEKFAIE